MYYTVGLIVLAVASVGVWLGAEFLSEILPQPVIWSICFILGIWGFSSLIRAVCEDSIKSSLGQQIDNIQKYLNNLKDDLANYSSKGELSDIKELLIEIKEILRVKNS